MRSGHESRYDSLEFWENAIPELEWRRCLSGANTLITGMSRITKNLWVLVSAGRDAQTITPLERLRSDTSGARTSAEIDCFVPQGRHALNPALVKRMRDWISLASAIAKKRKKREKMEELVSESTL